MRCGSESSDEGNRPRPPGVDPQNGAVDRTAPFTVVSARPDQSGLYYDEPEVIAQFLLGERYARFQAEWVEEEGEWKFGKRVADA
jgi:hypothetical protein